MPDVHILELCKDNLCGKPVVLCCKNKLITEYIIADISFEDKASINRLYHGSADDSSQIVSNYHSLIQKQYF